MQSLQGILEGLGETCLFSSPGEMLGLFLEGQPPAVLQDWECAPPPPTEVAELFRVCLLDCIAFSFFLFLSAVRAPWHSLSHS